MGVAFVGRAGKRGLRPALRLFRSEVWVLPFSVLLLDVAAVNKEGKISHPLSSVPLPLL